MKQTSLRKMILRMTAILLGIVGVGIFVSALLSGYSRKQAEESIQSATQYYADGLDDSFMDINDYLGELVFQDKDVSTICYTTDKLQFIQAVQKVNEKLEFYRTKLQGNFQFFIYYPELAYFVSSERGELETKEFAFLKEEMARYIMTDYENSGLRARKQWWLTEIAGKTYALNYIFFEDRYACCFIEAGDLADCINVIHLGEESFVTLVTEEGHPGSNHAMLEERGLYDADSGRERLDENVFGMKYMMIHQPLEYARFGICVVVQNNKNMIHVMIFQGIICLFILLGICIASILLYQVKKYMIEPMRYFSENLTRIREESQDVYFDQVGIAELSQANELFENICGQVRELKIRTYEQQLEQQKLLLDYMHLQIQPHFYINCMSLIYNMAVMGEDDSIQKLSACVSDYFRYIFRAESDRVALGEELRHVTNYLEICQIRYQDRLVFGIEKEPGLDEVGIPPLLIHTFVENAVKYAIDNEKTTDVRVAVCRGRKQGREFAQIVIEDNGAGFPDSVLESLRQDKDIVTERGTRIGIRNCIRRLDCIYGSPAGIFFENKAGAGAGARVCIQIPMQGEEGR